MNDELNNQILLINTANLLVNLQILQVNSENARKSKQQNQQIISLLTEIREELKNDST